MTIDFQQQRGLRHIREFGVKGKRQLQAIQLLTDHVEDLVSHINKKVQLFRKRVRKVFLQESQDLDEELPEWAIEMLEEDEGEFTESTQNSIRKELSSALDR